MCSAEELEAFTKLLQVCLSPIVLISGVGLILLSVVNRMGRPIDRIRQLLKDMAGHSPEEMVMMGREVKILYRRAEILRASVASIIVSIFFSSLIIMALFVTYLTRTHFEGTIIVLLSLSVMAIISSVILFLWDVTLGLNAVKLELQDRNLLR